MNRIKAGTVFLLQRITVHIFLIHTAVLEGIAVFFYSTYFLLSPIHSRKSNYIFNESASALQWVRFFVVGKSLLLTFYRSRAPPLGLDFLMLKNFKTGGNQNEN